MSPEKQREIASKGGKSLSIEVRREIGRKGGMARAEKLRKNLLENSSKQQQPNPPQAQSVERRNVLADQEQAPRVEPMMQSVISEVEIAQPGFAVERKILQHQEQTAQS